MYESESAEHHHLILIQRTTIPGVEFQEIIESTVDSGLGPDGIPYSAWAKAGDGVQQILYKLYCDLCNYGEIGEDFTS